MAKRYVYRGHVMHVRPAVLPNSDGENILLPLWLKVPKDFKLSDVEVIDDRPEKYPIRCQEASDSSDEVYQIVIEDVKMASCTCLGYMYNRTCKHIQRARIKHGCLVR